MKWLIPGLSFFLFFFCPNAAMDGAVFVGEMAAEVSGEEEEETGSGGGTCGGAKLVLDNASAPACSLPPHSIVAVKLLTSSSRGNSTEADQTRPALESAGDTRELDRKLERRCAVARVSSTRLCMC